MTWEAINNNMLINVLYNNQNNNINNKLFNNKKERNIFKNWENKKNDWDEEKQVSKQKFWKGKNWGMNL